MAMMAKPERLPNRQLPRYFRCARGYPSSCARACSGVLAWEEAGLLTTRSTTKILATALVLLGGCSNPSSNPPSDGDGPRPSKDVSSPSPQQSVVLFSEDYSDRSGGWPTGSPPSVNPHTLSYGYVRSEYMISIGPGRKLGFNLPAPATKTSMNVRIDVDVRQLGEPAIWGVYCNGNAENRSFYTFTVGLQGSWGIGRVDPGGGELLAKGLPSESIPPGSPAIHLTATCRAETSTGSVHLSMAVDGKELLQAVDRHGLVGRFHGVPGLYIESSNLGDVRVLFDNFLFRGLP